MNRKEKAAVATAAVLGLTLTASCGGSVDTGPVTSSSRPSTGASGPVRTGEAPSSPSKAAGSKRNPEGHGTAPATGLSGTPGREKHTPKPLPTQGLPVVDCTHPTQDALKGGKSNDGNPTGIISVYILANQSHEAFAVTDVDDRTAEVDVTTSSGTKLIKGDGVSGHVVVSSEPAVWTFKGSWQTFCNVGSEVPAADSKLDDLANHWGLSPVSITLFNGGRPRQTSREAYEKNPLAA